MKDDGSDPKSESPRASLNWGVGSSIITSAFIAGRTDNFLFARQNEAAGAADATDVPDAGGIGDSRVASLKE
jgi:hypothetical protein